MLTVDLNKGPHWLRVHKERKTRARRVARWRSTRILAAEAFLSRWLAGEFDEGQHPRDERGRFAPKGEGAWGPGEVLPGRLGPQWVARGTPIVGIPAKPPTIPGQQPIQLPALPSNPNPLADQPLPGGQAARDILNGTVPHGHQEAPGTAFGHGQGDTWLEKMFGTKPSALVDPAVVASVRDTAQARLTKVETEIAKTSPGSPAAQALEAERAKLQAVLGPGGALALPVGGAWLVGGVQDRAGDLGFAGNSLVTPPKLDGRTEIIGDQSRGNANVSYKITEPDGTAYCFKPISDEEWSARPQYIYNREFPLAAREVVFARMNKEGAFDMMTNVVMVNNPRLGEGSAMGWVANSTQAKNSSPGYFNRDEIARLSIMDVVGGNLDRHMGNAMIDSNHGLHAIDHGYTFGTTMPGGHLRSFPLFMSKKDDITPERQRFFADRLTKMNWDKVLGGAKLSTKERVALKERTAVAIRRLRAGEYHLLKQDFDVSP